MNVQVKVVLVLIKAKQIALRFFIKELNWVQTSEKHSASPSSPSQY